jgi:hypothetical protein
MNLRTGIVLAICIMVLGSLFPVLSVLADRAQVLPAKVDECRLVCKNLKQDWNYLFHPEMVNQCEPRRLKTDESLEELSKRAFTRDDPFIRRYCGSPFRL